MQGVEFSDVDYTETEFRHVTTGRTRRDSSIRDLALRCLPGTPRPARAGRPRRAPIGRLREGGGGGGACPRGVGKA
ncbi:hypothetical protein EVAR_100528_1 [Eumeta japonica]|uniref:Uncharacterized protein n=1 Tax=Eumeta variegata TaxID=151549 RepID=A0A4C2A7H4_EUMVA|nr:hypothetical protein EVAR_100528_1 [Eumeta japonica]